MLDLKNLIVLFADTLQVCVCVINYTGLHASPAALVIVMLYESQFLFPFFVLFLLIFRYLGTCQVSYLTPGAHETCSKHVLQFNNGQPPISKERLSFLIQPF